LNDAITAFGREVVMTTCAIKVGIGREQARANTKRKEVAFLDGKATSP
jgi:hypothetical protein